MTDQPGTKRIGRHRFVIVGGIMLCSLLFVAGIALLLAGVRDWRRNSASVNWPTTEAEVINSKLVRRIFPPTRYSQTWEGYTLEMTFRYTVDGKGYISEVKWPVVAPTSAGAGPSSDLMTFAAPGRQFKARYDPRDPTTIIVPRGDAKTAWFSMGTGAVLAVLSFLFILLLRSNLAQPES